MTALLVSQLSLPSSSEEMKDLFIFMVFLARPLDQGNLAAGLALLTCRTGQDLRLRRWDHRMLHQAISGSRNVQVQLVVDHMVVQCSTQVVINVETV